MTNRTQASAFSVCRDWALTERVNPLVSPLARLRLATILWRCRRVFGRKTAVGVLRSVHYACKYPAKHLTDLEVYCGRTLPIPPCEQQS